MLHVSPADMEPGGLNSTVMKSLRCRLTPTSLQWFTVYETLVSCSFLRYTLPSSKSLKTTSSGLLMKALPCMYSVCVCVCVCGTCTCMYKLYYRIFYRMTLTH